MRPVADFSHWGALGAEFTGRTGKWTAGKPPFPSSGVLTVSTSPYLARPGSISIPHSGQSRPQSRWPRAVSVTENRPGLRTRRDGRGYQGAERGLCFLSGQPTSGRHTLCPLAPFTSQAREVPGLLSFIPKHKSSDSVLWARGAVSEVGCFKTDPVSKIAVGSARRRTEAAARWPQGQARWETPGNCGRKQVTCHRSPRPPHLLKRTIN